MDNRTYFEKMLWNTIGEPLYYCSNCKKYVKVKEINGKVEIKRFCNCNAEIFAPRKSILSGKGIAGLSIEKKIKFRFSQIASKITGRNV